MKRTTVCVNIDQSNSFTDAEKAQARRNIGVSNYSRTVNNVVLSQTRNITADDDNVINLYNFKFYNTYEYHTFLTIPLNIKLANYNKDKVIITIWIGAANWSAAPFKMRLRSNVENGVVQNRASIIPIDWVGEYLNPDDIGDINDYMHVCFFDNDDGATLINLEDNQTLSFSFRGTEAYTIYS